MGYLRYTDEEIAAAIPGTGGIWTDIARKVGCNRQTVINRVKGSAELQELYNDERQSVGDDVEGVLFRAMREDEDLQSIRWFLARTRRDEYGDSIDLGIEGDVSISFTWVHDQATDD
jgi:hypothetical protein